MICQTAQDWLMYAEHPVRLADAPSDVAAHIHGCRSCQKAMAKIVRLDEAWRGLSLPASAASAKAKFLERTLNRTLPHRRPVPWRWLVPAGLAAAISLVLLLAVGIGVGMWLLNRPSMSSPGPEIAKNVPAPKPQTDAEVVLDKLVDWNLRLTESKDAEERVQLFSQNFELLKANLQNVSLVED